MGDRYGSFCPVAKAAEVATGRWTPLILSELMMGSRRFGDIQRGVPLMPRSLLARRLKELEIDGLLERKPLPGTRGHSYTLTPAGDALRPVIDALAHWGQTYGVNRIGHEDANVAVLMWSLEKRIALARLPDDRVVLHFEFRNVPQRDFRKRLWWLILDRGTADICVNDPGHAVDLTIRADLDTFQRIYMGYASLREAIRTGEVLLEGAARWQAELPRWLSLSEPPQPFWLSLTSMAAAQAKAAA